MDDYGHEVHYGVYNIEGSYLEVSNYGKSFTNYTATSKKGLVNSASVFFPQVPITTKGSNYRLSHDMVVELNLRSNINTQVN